MGRSLPDRLVYDCLSSAIVRVIISTVVILVSFGGLLMYPSFSKELDVGVAPPPDSPAGIARDEMAKWFDPDPIQITAHVRTRDGSPLTNDDVAACAALAARRDGPLALGCPQQQQQEEAQQLGLPPPPSQPPLPPIDGAIQNVSDAFKAIVAKYTTKATNGTAGTCNTSFTSYWAIPSVQVPWPGINASATNLLRRLLAPSLFARGKSETLMLVSITACNVKRDGRILNEHVTNGCVTSKKDHCTPIQSLSDEWKAYATHMNAVDPRLEITIVSLPDVFAAALDGVDQTMRVSTMTAPLAFGILACVLRNVRFLLIPLINIVACLMGTTIVMYFVAKHSDVTSQAPALMLACSLAMSIDYSLFLLTRFRDELVVRKRPRRASQRAGAHHDASPPSPQVRKRPYRAAIVTMLETSGHTVLVSGVTLTLCFLGMLLIPVSTISSLGVASAVTVAFAITMALIFTPTMLLAFPAFFTDESYYGCSFSACLCGWWCQLCGGGAAPPAPPVGNSVGKAPPINQPFLEPGSSTSSSPSRSREQRLSVDPERMTDVLESPAPDAAVHTAPVALLAIAAKRARRGCWPTVGGAVQKPWAALLVLGALGGIAVPFVMPLASSDLTYVEGVTPLLPRKSETTDSFLQLQDSFGVSHVFPTQVVTIDLP